MKIKNLTDTLLQKYGDEKNLLSQIRKAEKDTWIFQKFIHRNPGVTIQNELKNSLGKYTTGVKKHLRHLSLFKRFDSTLRTKEFQYHLYMIEIELTNRLYVHAFKNSDYKFALFPHCIRDFRDRCLSVSGDIEHVCKACNKDCLINHGSALLKKYEIDPYISVTMDQKKLFKDLKADHQSLGALGVACVPELARGMRLCLSLGIPAVGVPLDVNRCARWMGRAYETSFNMSELKDLLK
jgi:hypothetical protein